MNSIELNINKNNTATLNTGMAVIELSPVYRTKKDMRFNMYTVRSGKAILTTYAVPNKAQSVKLAVIETKRNHHKLEVIRTKNLIVKSGYLAIKGHTMKLGSNDGENTILKTGSNNDLDYAKLAKLLKLIS